MKESARRDGQTVADFPEWDAGWSKQIFADKHPYRSPPSAKAAPSLINSKINAAMKVIVAGSTGYIGREVLAHCLNHASITSVIILTRRQIPAEPSHPKAKLITVNDFMAYDASTLDELQSADAAIWCIGTYTGDEKVDIELPLAFLKAVTTRSRGSELFRYVHVGGAFTEPPPKKGQEPRALWYFTNGRRVRGAAEAKVMEFQEQGKLEVYIVKPGAVFAKNAGFWQWCVGDSVSVKIDELAAAMVDLVVRGNEGKVLLNREIAKRGRDLQAGAS